MFAPLPVRDDPDVGVLEVGAPAPLRARHAAGVHPWVLGSAFAAGETHDLRQSFGGLPFPLPFSAASWMSTRRRSSSLVGGSEISGSTMLTGHHPASELGQAVVSLRLMRTGRERESAIPFSASCGDACHAAEPSSYWVAAVGASARIGNDG
jgi:hypothetical protein